MQQGHRQVARGLEQDRRPLPAQALHRRAPPLPLAPLPPAPSRPVARLPPGVVRHAPRDAMVWVALAGGVLGLLLLLVVVVRAAVLAGEVVGAGVGVVPPVAQARERAPAVQAPPGRRPLAVAAAVRLQLLLVQLELLELPPLGLRDGRKGGQAGGLSGAAAAWPGAPPPLPLPIVPPSPPAFPPPKAPAWSRGSGRWGAGR